MKYNVVLFDADGVTLEEVKDFAHSDKSKILFIDDANENIKTAEKFGFDTIFYEDFSDLNELS